MKKFFAGLAVGVLGGSYATVVTALKSEEIRLGVSDAISHKIQNVLYGKKPIRLSYPPADLVVSSIRKGARK